MQSPPTQQWSYQDFAVAFPNRTLAGEVRLAPIVLKNSLLRWA
jgi:hypothetical protein